MNKFLTIPTNKSSSRKNNKIPILKIQNIQLNRQMNNNNNKFYKETISSANKKYSMRNISPIIVTKKKTEEEYNEIEIKNHQQIF